MHAEPVNDSPSVRERRLAQELRLLREAGQLHGKDVAERLGWSASKVSRIENGRIGISPDDLEVLLGLYEVPEQQALLLRRLAPSARPKGWWDAYADALSAGYANLIRLEAGSQALRCYAALIPHALLLTPEYLREVILATWDRPAPAEIDRRLVVCRRRQEVLQPDRPGGTLELSAVIDESVLHRRVHPDPAVMRGQLQRLLDVAEQPNVTVQLLPFDAGAPPVTAGSFSVLESRATGTEDVVYLENKTRIFFLDTEGEVHRYARSFELISEMALDPDRSADRIRRAMADL
jgi:transcriptional regulator with XRE-family HTH domain